MWRWSPLSRWPSAGSGTNLDALIHTVEVRTVPVLRLEDVLAAIPTDVPISYLKTDVQGFDLQVIQSAGEQLRRVYKVRAEVINQVLYKPLEGRQPVTEVELDRYMSQMGFRFLRDLDLARDRAWLDKEYVNIECWTVWDRFWHDRRYGPP